jgi:hypothetical protein
MQQRYTEKLRADFKNAVDLSEALIAELLKFVGGAKEFLERTGPEVAGLAK